MREFLLEPLFWNWVAFGLLLLVAEIFVSGFFLLWLGVAALITGLVTFLAPMLDTDYQLLLFSVFSIATVAGWQWHLRRRPRPHDDNTLNRRGSEYIGKSYMISHPITNGRGELTLDGITWRVIGPDCAAGSRVRVINIDGNRLVVTPETSVED